MRILPQSDPAKRPIVNPSHHTRPQGTIPQARFGGKTDFVLFAFVIVVLVLSIKSPALFAAEDCLSCHGPGTGMVNSQGKPITVNPAALAHSVHKDLGCVDCHAGAAQSGHT